MNGRAWLAWAIVGGLLIGSAWAQPKERTGEIRLGNEQETAKTIKEVEGLKGTILLVSLRDEILLKTETGYRIVHHGEEFWDLGLDRGDEIAVWGQMFENNPFGNEINGTRIELVKKAERRPDPLELQSIADVQRMRFGDRVVLTYGSVSEFSGSRMKIDDQGSNIWVELRTKELRDRFADALGTRLIVVGELKIKPMGKEIDVITIRRMETIKRPGEPDQAQDIADILREKPIGKLVKARGRIAVFIGDVEAAILYQGEDVLVVFRSDRYLSADLPSGQEVNVVGIYSEEVLRDRTRGVLREARVDVTPLVKAREDIKKYEEKNQ